MIFENTILVVLIFHGNRNWCVIVFTTDTRKQALELFTDFKDIEDAIQVQTALTFKMDYFLTSDMQLMKASSETLPIINASAFLKNIAVN